MTEPTRNSSADNSQRIEERKLQFVEALSKLVGPVTETLDQQKTITGLLDTVSKAQAATSSRQRVGGLLSTLAVLAVGGLLWLTTERAEATAAKVDATVLILEAQQRENAELVKALKELTKATKDVKQAVDEKPTVSIEATEPAFPGDRPKARVVIRPGQARPPEPTKDQPHPKKPPPPPAIELPVQLPPDAKVAPNKDAGADKPVPKK